MNKLLNVVIPAYRRIKLLEKSIESRVNLTTHGFGILNIDSASTGENIRLVDQFGATLDTKPQNVLSMTQKDFLPFAVSCFMK